MDYSTRTDITHSSVPQNKANIKFPLIFLKIYSLSYRKIGMNIVYCYEWGRHLGASAPLQEHGCPQVQDSPKTVLFT